MPPESTVFIVDDDPAIRKLVSALLRSVRLLERHFATAADFLANYDGSQPGCLVLDLRLPDMSGRQLQQLLAERRSELPIIFLSGHGDLETAVGCMKCGAHDFIEKPFSGQRLIDAVQCALTRYRVARERKARCTAIKVKLASLTPREREVLDGIVSGQPSKAIAAELHICEKTVEYHRANIMQKMQARSVAELVRMTQTVAQVAELMPADG